MSAPKRIQRQRIAGWKMPHNTIYVGRPTPWGNPFVVHRNSPFDAAQAVQLYRDLVLNGEVVFIDPADGTPFTIRRTARGVLAVPDVATIRRELAGRDLACWCPLDQPCHADALLELAISNDPKGAHDGS